MKGTRICFHLPPVLIDSVRAFAVVAWLAAGTALAAPANDDFADAIDLTGAGAGQSGEIMSGIQTGTNTSDASLQVGEPNMGPTNSVWFKWTCPADGDLTVTSLGSTNLDSSEWDAILGMFSGTDLNALTPLGTTPQDTIFEESMTVALAAGETCYTAVHHDL